MKARLEDIPVKARPGYLRLTPKDVRILHLLSEGLANKQIAARTGKTELTIKQDVSQVMLKLEASNRTQAVVTALRLGVISL